MNAITQLLLGIVSGEAALVVGAIAWSGRRLVRQLDTQGKLLEKVATDMAVHQAWHIGLDARDALRTIREQ